MTNFINSTRNENIFYGDIFKLNGKGILVFGSGKTKAMREAVKVDLSPGNEIALDMACITRENDMVFGHFEMSIRAEGIDDPINEKIQLDYFINMLTEETTNKIFKDTPSIIEVEFNDFLDLSGFNIGFSTSILQSPLTDNPKIRMDKFRELTEDARVKYYSIPWMNSEIEKGQLIREFFSTVESGEKY